jgi:large subunit ribosomal protein L18
MQRSRTESRLKRHHRRRRTIIGTADRPRLQIQRTLHHIYAFVVNDSEGKTLVAASTREKDVAAGLSSCANREAAQRVGEAIGKKAKAAGIERVVFDTGGRKYHGRVAALADAARGAGLEF